MNFIISIFPFNLIENSLLLLVWEEYGERIRGVIFQKTVFI